LCVFKRRLAADLLDCLEVLFGEVVGRPCLYQGRLCGIQIATGDRSLCKQLAATLDDALIKIEGGFRFRKIELGAGVVFRGDSARRGIVRCLCGGVRSLAIELGCGDVASSSPAFTLEPLCT
jgi:hypothetical protein